MGSDSIDLYTYQAEGISNELMTYLKEFEYSAIQQMVMAPGAFERFHNPDADIMKISLTMVGKSPGQIRKSFESLWVRDPEKLAQIMITSAALAQMSYLSFRNDRGNSGYVGMGYRAATKELAGRLLGGKKYSLSEQIGKKLERVMSSAAYQAAERKAKRDSSPEGEVVPEMSQQDIWKIEGIHRHLKDYVDHLEKLYEDSFGTEDLEALSFDEQQKIAVRCVSAEKSLQDLMDLYPEILEVEEDEMEGPS